MAPADKNSRSFSPELAVSVRTELFRYSSTAFNFSDKTSAWLIKFLESLQEFFGIKLLVRIPENFLAYSSELWEGLTLLDRMREGGMALNAGKIPQFPDEPKIHTFFVKTSGQKKGPDGAGFSFLDPARALWAAIGEAVERYALSIPNPARHKTASWNELGKEALNIFALAGISRKRRRAGHQEFNLDFDENSHFKWIQGRSLTQNKKIWIPLQLVSFAHRDHHEKKEPMLRQLVSTGAAAHKSLDAAILAGLLEVIERDAFMISWLNKLSPPVIDLTSVKDEGLQRIFGELKRYSLEFFILLLPSDIPVHTILTCIIDRSGVGPAISLGAKSGFNLIRTIEGSVSEAFSCRIHVRTLISEQKSQPGNPFLDVRNLNREGRLLWWSVLERIKDINFLLAGRKINIGELPSYKSISEQDGLKNLIHFLKEKNIEVVYTDILGKKLTEELGFYAVMVTAPDLQPMHLNEGLPYLDGERLLSVPKFCGLFPAEKINNLPHPFP